MRILLFVIIMSLCACSSNTQSSDNAIVLKKNVTNKNTGVVFKIPEKWGVIQQNESEGSFVASKNGHGFERCRIGKIKINKDIFDKNEDITLADIDNYFMKNGVALIEQKNKVKFIQSASAKIPGIIIGGTHENELGSGVAINGFVKNIEAHENNNMVIYIAYSEDIDNKVGVECSMIGKDKNKKFLNLVKEISKSINYKNEYYQ